MGIDYSYLSTKNSTHPDRRTQTDVTAPPRFYGTSTGSLLHYPGQKTNRAWRWLYSKSDAERRAVKQPENKNNEGPVFTNFCYFLLFYLSMWLMFVCIYLSVCTSICLSVYLPIY